MSEILYLVQGDAEYQVHEIPSQRYGTFLGGIGMPPVTHIVQRAPRQDGDTLLDVRLEPRQVTVGILQWQPDRATYWSERRALLEMLKRFSGLKLRLVIGDTGESFDIDVAYEAGAELGTDGSLGLRDFSAALQLRAHNPIWYATNPTSLVVGIPKTWDAGVLPWIFGDGGITFGSLTIAEEIALTYAGTWRAYPQIDIRGPITNPTIVNSTTGERLELVTTISDNDVVRIDLSPLQKTVWNITDNTNEIDTLSEDSDLATWHLAPSPEAPEGINALSLGGTDGGAHTAITLRWHDQYIGV